MKAGLYFHIPYCIRKCDYCDFYSVSDTSEQSNYFKAIHQEMESYRERQLPVDSIFIGGGTPSVADPKEIAQLLEKARTVFQLSSDTEITIELNPKTFDKEKLSVYRDAGVNRISMGLQSANNDELKKLGRIHTVEEFLASYELLQQMGFSDINTDIMYALPDSDPDTLEKTLAFVKNLNCQHISAYALTLAETSCLYQRGYTFPDDDGVFEQYEQVCEALAAYRHYEISNFVQQTKAPCRHNLKYWTRAPYLGFGAAAHSFFEENRWSNPADISRYIQAVQEEIAPADKETISPKEARQEALMLSLRTDRGVLYQNLDSDFYTLHRERLHQYEKLGYVLCREDGFCLTQKGFFVSNAIIASLLAETD